MTATKSIVIADKPVGRIGLGLMMLTLAPKETRPTDEEAFASIK
jgi:hypothetical protein